MSVIGIIGGSGLDNPDILHDARDVEVKTRFGAPSALLRKGVIKGRDVVILARHGREHTIPPTHVNYRANIMALKEAGCTSILATTACGSLRQEIDRGHLIVLDQFIDFTRLRHVSFHETFDPHSPAHTGMAEPFDATLRARLIDSCERLGLVHHKRGTVITIEGSRFSTRAESNMFRMWGADVINMSVAPECILANEAGIPYASIAMSTDYDCWKTDEEPVTWDHIIKVVESNVERVTSLLTDTIAHLD
jgi:5'-methylthioadenosine phosphorylase